MSGPSISSRVLREAEEYLHSQDKEIEYVVVFAKNDRFHV
jgi:hypothetical protein